MSYEEFGVRFIQVAVTTERIAAVIGSVTGDQLTVGPVSVGPGGAARATAIARIAPPEVTPTAEAPVSFVASLPVDLDLEVTVVSRRHRYQADLKVLLRLVVRAIEPLTLVLDIDDVDPRDVRDLHVRASGVGSLVLQRLGGLENELRRHVASVVAERMRSAEVHAASVIEVGPLVDVAWEHAYGPSS